MTDTTAKLDRLAIALSAVCLVHCLALPLAVTLLPVLGANLLSHATFHQLMLLVVLPSSIAAFFMGCRKHGQGSVAALGGVGLALLVVAALAVESTWGAHAERWVTLLGAAVLSLAHLQNFRHCRHARCTHDHS